MWEYWTLQCQAGRIHQAKEVCWPKTKTLPSRAMGDCALPTPGAQTSTATRELHLYRTTSLQMAVKWLEKEEAFLIGTVTSTGQQQGCGSPAGKMGRRVADLLPPVPWAADRLCAHRPWQVRRTEDVGIH